MSGDSRIPTIGIIGAGSIGQAFARLVLRAGREVVIANRRGLQSPRWSGGVISGEEEHAAAARIMRIDAEQLCRHGRQG